MGTFKGKLKVWPSMRMEFLWSWVWCMVHKFYHRANQYFRRIVRFVVEVKKNHTRIQHVEIVWYLNVLDRWRTSRRSSSALFTIAAEELATNLQCIIFADSAYWPGLRGRTSQPTTNALQSGIGDQSPLVSMHPYGVSAYAWTRNQ